MVAGSYLDYLQALRLHLAGIAPNQSGRNHLVVAANEMPLRDQTQLGTVSKRVE